MSQSEGLAGWEARAEQAHYRPGKLAKILGLSEIALRRAFSKEFGWCLSLRLQEVRLERIKQLLKEDQSNKQITDELDLKHESYLSFLFQRETGVTIREYRHALNHNGGAVPIPRRGPGQMLTTGTGNAAKSGQVAPSVFVFADDKGSRPRLNSIPPTDRKV